MISICALRGPLHVKPQAPQVPLFSVVLVFTTAHIIHPSFPTPRVLTHTPPHHQVPAGSRPRQHTNGDQISPLAVCSLVSQACQPQYFFTFASFGLDLQSTKKTLVGEDPLWQLRDRLLTPVETAIPAPAPLCRFTIQHDNGIFYNVNDNGIFFPIR